MIEANAETVLEEIGVNFPDSPRRWNCWREAGAEVRGERVRIPPRPRPPALRHRAGERTSSTPATPSASRSIGGRELVLAPVYGPPFVRDIERRPALCDDRGLPQFREARLDVAVAAPFRRHGLRADGCAR